MRLAQFILANMEPILAEWEIFAARIWPGAPTDKATLRDHAEDILRATVQDMGTHQTAEEQSDKSKGDGGNGAGSVRIDRASVLHGNDRVKSGFDLMQLASEYRALRATVTRLWRESEPHCDGTSLDDLTRFDECIDQSLAEAQQTYTEAVNRSRLMFLGILSHDLRGPLNAITMSAEVLLRTQPSDDASARILSGVASSATAMARMVNDLLDFTGAGLGASMSLSVADMDVEPLCREVIDETRAAHPDADLRFESAGDLTGQLDAGRLRQVLSNLLENAVHHGQGAGPVDVSAVGSDAEIRVSVRNGGPPIPPDSLTNIFDPLVRAAPPHVQHRRVRGSIGLGLHIAREIVLAHAGQIDVTSTADAGTCFTVRLPRRAVAGD